MVLYHYCSTQTFHSIIQNRAIWLSSLSLSNDTTEGVWVRKVFDDICRDENLGPWDMPQALEQLANLNNVADGLGFCLSEDGDMLSQWRGYAANASGMCIGFSPEYFKELDEQYKSDKKPRFTLLKVQYDLEKQKRLIRPIFDEIQETIKNSVAKGGTLKALLGLETTKEENDKDTEKVTAVRELTEVIFDFFPYLFQLKNPAFAEEKEWRLLSYFFKNHESCNYRAGSDRLIPYRPFELLKLPTLAIREVIIGPKNLTPPELVRSFLKNNQFLDVNVKRSEATYR